MLTNTILLLYRKTSNAFQTLLSDALAHKWHGRDEAGPVLLALPSRARTSWTREKDALVSGRFGAHSHRDGGKGL